MGSRSTSEDTKRRVSGTLDALSLQTKVPDATASTPVSAGTSSPQYFHPPQRPSSTPFPQVHVDEYAAQLQCRDHLDTDTDEDEGLAAGTFSQETESSQQTVASSVSSTTLLSPGLGGLPVEIVENILDYILGFRVSGSSGGHGEAWVRALRHARRKEVANLALVNRTWRHLVQGRIYRHINLRAKTADMAEYRRMFRKHLHLQDYVKHLEIWFPVFEPWHVICSLEEVFQMAQDLFPQARVLTLQGGNRKKAPKVRTWTDSEGSDSELSESELLPLEELQIYDPGSECPGGKRFAKLALVETLICKGQWNLIRASSDARTILSALPNLQEWQAAYSKPKSKSYLTMAVILRCLPKSGKSYQGGANVILPNLLTKNIVQPGLGAPLYRLNLFIENDCRHEARVPKHANKVRSVIHFCLQLAEASVTLRHLSFTGRFCHFLFDRIARLHKSRTTYLKSVDLTLKNTCRAVHLPTPEVPEPPSTASGITHERFIHSFEQLVISALKALKSLPRLEYLRIRFVDLDNAVPGLNPYFILDGNNCSGVWSEEIIALLAEVRPLAAFEELSHDLPGVEVVGRGDERKAYVLPGVHPLRNKSLKLSKYKELQRGIVPAPAPAQ